MKDVVSRNIIITEGKGFMEVEELRENTNEEEEEGEKKRLKKRIYGGRGVEGEYE